MKNMYTVPTCTYTCTCFMKELCGYEYVCGLNSCAVHIVSVQETLWMCLMQPSVTVEKVVHWSC